MAEKIEQAFEDVNNETFFREPNSEPHPKTEKRKRSPKSKQMLWQPLSPPMDENDWLAIMDEPGQTFDEFVEFITTQTGRFNSNHFGGATRNAETTRRHCIGLVPIIQGSDLDTAHGAGGGGAENTWSEHGPDFDDLVKFTEIYFDRKVHVLDQATLTVQTPKKNKPGAFVGAVKWEHPSSHRTTTIKMCRIAPNETDTRMQVHVDPLLSQLASIREAGGAQVDECFAIMGVTMIDLYSSSSTSLSREWYARRKQRRRFQLCSIPPVFEDEPRTLVRLLLCQEPKQLLVEDAPKKRPPTKPRPPSSVAIKSKMLFRACKLLVHEMMHIYGIDHCIYHECIMKGTGHLVEDFSALSTFAQSTCEKCNFVLVLMWQDDTEHFSVYTKHCNGWKKEAAWTKRMLETLNVGNVVSSLWSSQFIRYLVTVVSDIVIVIYSGDNE